MIFPQIYLDYFKMRQDYCQSLNVWSYLPWIFFSFGLDSIKFILQPILFLLYVSLLFISARILHRISIEMYEILWSLHVRIAQYVTIQFQREPTFVRFTDQGVGEEVELQIR
uniref:Uncharacterized protein n=1 Tax=Nomascus leucogenys TaxID=61853 RepID=A0A2I3HHU8_NOMLE